MDDNKWKDNDSLEDFNMNLAKVLEPSSGFCASTRLLAAELMQSPYKTVGQFFDQLSNDDLEVLVDKVDNEELEEILLLTTMLARAEGVAVTDIGDITKKTNMMTVFLVGESLARKGLAKIVHSAMTFEDSDAVFLKRIDL